MSAKVNTRTITNIPLSPEAKIIAAMGGQIFDGGDFAYDRQTPAGKIYRNLNEAAAEDQWDDAEELLSRLYALVGEATDDTGYAYHCGKSDLQTYIAAQED